jgi:hypothetical protein
MKAWLTLLAAAALVTGCASYDSDSDEAVGGMGATGGTTVYGPEGAGESLPGDNPLRGDRVIERSTGDLNRTDDLDDRALPPQENTVPDQTQDSGIEDTGASLRGPL